jgi:hypothetical protein
LAARGARPGKYAILENCPAFFTGDWEPRLSDEPENFTLAQLRKIDGKVDSLAGEVADMRKVMGTKHDIADVRSELRSEIHSLRADVASDMMALEKRLGDQISGLRRSVMEYHSSAIGHGVLLTELEERLRRLAHVGLTPEGH